MSSYQPYYGNGFGVAPFHHLMLSEGRNAILYAVPEGDENGNESVSFGLGNGSLFSVYPLNVPNTIFSEFKFKVNRGGNCLSFDFELNRMPDTPILKYTTVAIRINNLPRFFGYITKRPVEGEDGGLRYSGYGTSKRLEKRRIFNDEKYIVSDIAGSGSSMVVTLTGSAFTVSGLVGQKIIITDHVEDKNNGVFEITANDATTVTVLNPSRIASTTVSGLGNILPTYWTDSILISEFLKSTLQNHISIAPAIYIAAKIEATTGIVTAGSSNFAAMEYNRFYKVIENILQNKYWFGIDGSNQFFLRLKSPDVITTFFAGYDLPEADIKIDEEVDGNSVTIYRSGSKSGRRNGAVIAGTASDATSIAKFGESAYTEDIPAWLSNETGQSYAESLLTFMSQPSIQAKADNMPYKWYEFGTYRYVTEVGNFNFDLLDFDNFTDWTTGANITRALSSTILVNGSNSHRLDLTPASINQTHILNNQSYRTSGAKSLTFYARSTTPVTFQVGVGTVYTDNLFTVQLSGINRYEPVTIDLSGASLNKIVEVGFKILAVNNCILYLDYMTLNQYANKHYTFELDEAEYVFAPHERKVNLKFGDTRKNPGFGEYIAGVKAQVELAKLMIRE